MNALKCFVLSIVATLFLLLFIYGTAALAQRDLGVCADARWSEIHFNRSSDGGFAGNICYSVRTRDGGVARLPEGDCEACQPLPDAGPGLMNAIQSCQEQFRTERGCR